jgi:MazG family protein
VKEIEKLRQTVATLRGPGGCPWDREQDHQSLAVCLIEECAELLDTIDRMDMPHMREELGDVLLQVVFHAQLAEERGDFNLADVASEIDEKLIRRHPHVFGESEAKDSAAVLKQWEEIKAAEKKNGTQSTTSRFKDLPRALPALLYAHDVYKQISKKEMVGKEQSPRREAAQLAQGLRNEEDLGRRLFELAAAARERGWDPESALRRYANQVKEKCDTDC